MQIEMRDCLVLFVVFLFSISMGNHPIKEDLSSSVVSVAQDLVIVTIYMYIYCQHLRF